ncbi:putative transcriptional regulator [Shewanella sp. MR-4]|uniref:sacsin N-terminal ATP-binding-like domain-containing protein n=1 Tax=Shewanella sp. (strain MR-4) TaxID=60480 RepID=UPI0000DE1CBF|nr:RNA-binding domain-containing protein [Shewanella sp. MR-4]ABI40278.1 putative transcriptional regulator [Shewanella sp. MR-4]
MKMKEVIDGLFHDNSNYATPDQATNQASSLVSLSTDLYTDSKRFIYELLQNADDSAEPGHSVKVWIKVFGNSLVVAHSGREFSPRDVRGICNVNYGTKKEDSSKTGYKGIGFKSVFGQSDKVTIFTANEYFRFDASYPFNWIWDGTKEEWEAKSDREFVNPWQIIPIYTDVREGILKPIELYLKTINANVATIIELNDKGDVLLALKELSEDVNMYLFLKSISSINFDIDNRKHIEIDRSESNRIVLKDGQSEQKKWLTSSITLNVPSDLKVALQDERNIPDKLLNAETIELTLAAKTGADGIIKLSQNERRIYSYLPTEETKYSLPVLVNTSFLTNANRENLHADSKWNQWLFKCISVEVFKWIARLVETEYQYQAYKLIPDRIHNDELGTQFNIGRQEAIETVAFVREKPESLVKIKDSIIDFTFLSRKSFIGEKAIKSFIDGSESTGKESTKVFVENTGFGKEFKALGASTFEWSFLHGLVKSKDFIDEHSIENNIELIKHLKYLSEKETFESLTKAQLSELAFIWDHKGVLNAPCNIYFPTSKDTNWNVKDSELSFIHPRLQDWLSTEIDIRSWLGNLGVVEKTDISFITKTIIPNAESYITEENAVKTMHDLFSLYKKGDLVADVLSSLSNLKLMTTQGCLLKASECFLSKIYLPRIEIEGVLNQDIFVSEVYLTKKADTDEWKRFFKFLGVQDGITCIKIEDKTSRTELVAQGYLNGYFDRSDKKFRPWQTTFTADTYSKISTLKYINYSINNYQFSLQFWRDIVENCSTTDLISFPIAFWGNSGRPGRTSGDKVGDYTSWFIKNLKCIPVVTKECESSDKVLLNTEEMKKIAGNYLPVFDGPQLTPNWLSFFDFKTFLEVSDYLKLLSEISKDTTEKGDVKKKNIETIQLVYKELLTQCVNWNEQELKQVEEWAKDSKLQNTRGIPVSCNSLKYFLDGNSNVFHDEFDFLELNAQNKNNPNLKSFLKAFNIKILEQSDFELIKTAPEKSNGLITKIKNIIPYFKVWVINECSDDKTKENITKLDDKLSQLDAIEADALQIKYSDIDFVRNVNLHFDKNKFYVTKPWNSNRVLIDLSDKLCNYFELLGHDKKLDFLLRSENIEINEHFKELYIEIPDHELFTNEHRSILDETIQKSLASITIRSFEDLEDEVEKKGISPDFFHIPSSDYKRLKYVQGLISRAVKNITHYLNSLPEYDCSNHYEIAKSIIGGITKNGKDVTIVARPSDNDEVLLYYTAEFDVLEYVDAELWCEDGENTPQKITLGQFLKLTEINKIPVTRLAISSTEVTELCNKPKSLKHEFNAVPLAPFQVAKIIASFANTEGGTLVFGINEITSNLNEIVGLSSDYRIGEIMTEAISFISPKPEVTFDWVNIDSRRLFVIKTEKTIDEVSLGNQIYIREGKESKIKYNITSQGPSMGKTLSIPDFEKTIAIIIGIENYAPRDNNKVPSVKYAENDALLFKKALIESLDVDEENIHLILNDEALHNNLLYDLQSLFHGLSSRDRLIFYYVGHGFHNGITNYLSTYDMHPMHVDKTAISLRDVLLDPLAKSKCNSAMIFIDACAQSFSDENSRNILANIDGDEIKLILSDSNYLASYFSCQPGQSSYSCDNLKQGIWTYHLSQAMTCKQPEAILSEKYVTDRSLSDYLARSVTSYVKDELGYVQNPKSILDADSENVLVKIS